VRDDSQIVFEGDLPQGIFFGGQETFLPEVAGAAGLFGRDAVVGQLMGMNAGQQFGALPDIVDPLAQEGAQRAAIGGVDVRRWDEIGAQQVREFFGIDAIVFVFAAMNGFEIESVGQDEGESRSLASIGKPIPAEHAFAANGQVVFIRLDEFEEALEVVVFDIGVDELFALPIHQADVHLASVKIDSAIELSGPSVILHNV